MTSARLTVVFWGTYDLSKPRTRILRQGLREAGVDVIEIHTDVWSRFADKSQIGRGAMFIALLKVLFSYPALIWRYIRAPKHDVVLVPYLGQFDVLVLWVFARLKGKPVVWDMFLSLYDTLVNDRQLVGKRSPTAFLLKSLEWMGCRAATRVLLDTKAHAAYISDLFALRSGHAVSVPVGAETDVFARQSPRQAHDGPTKVLFYGQLIPLHGIETILKAARSKRGQAHAWRIIGKGQQSDLVARALAGPDATHIIHENWIAYDMLVSAISDADICLGIFGLSRKAASVVPNKVYQCLSAGRTVVTRQSQAMQEGFPDVSAGLMLVPPANPDALLDAIDAARKADFPIIPDQALKTARPLEIGHLLCDAILVPLINQTETR
jgi:glycosyltransferase involved in cell wall biosynthesis